MFLHKQKNRYKHIKRNNCFTNIITLKLKMIKKGKKRKF